MEMPPVRQGSRDHPETEAPPVLEVPRLSGGEAASANLRRFGGSREMLCREAGGPDGKRVEAARRHGRG